MLQAMNTGHEGSHDDDPRQHPARRTGRLEMMVMMAGWSCRCGPSASRSPPRSSSSSRQTALTECSPCD